jgi:hypothetical protein
MNAKKSETPKQDKSIARAIIRILVVTVFILLIPLIAMQFTDEVKWDLTDFVVIGALLIGAGLLYELISRQLKTSLQRIILGAILLILLVLIWVDLAVGIFGLPFSGS